VLRGGVVQSGERIFGVILMHVVEAVLHLHMLRIEAAEHLGVVLQVDSNPFVETRLSLRVVEGVTLLLPSWGKIFVFRAFLIVFLNQ